MGVWKGEGAQNNGNRWSILLTLTPGESNSIVGTMVCPSLACGGELTLRRVNTQFIELTENLTYVGTCINRGTVILQPTSKTAGLIRHFLSKNVDSLRWVCVA